MTDPHNASDDVSGPHDLQSDDLRTEVEGLRAAMASRAPIEQAKGMLMGRFRCSEQVAFNVLVRWSQERNVKLRVIAEAIVDLSGDGPARDPVLAGWLEEALATTLPATLPNPLVRAVAALSTFVLDRSGLTSADVLGQLASSIEQVVALDGVGVMTVEPGGLVVSHATPGVQRAERAQEELHAGPCRDAADRSMTVIVQDLLAEQRWPEFEDVATSDGLRAVAAVPLRTPSGVTAVLDLYRTRPGGFAAEEIHSARVLSDLAASWLTLLAARA